MASARRLKTSALEIRNQRIRNLRDRMKTELDMFAAGFTPYFANAVASSLGYGFGIFVAQGSSFLCGVSCVSPFAPFIGATGIGCASILAGRCAVAHKMYPEHGKRAFMKTWTNTTRSDLLVDVFVGLAAYKLLGGRFRSVLPSNLHFPGAYADRSLIVRGPKANGDQRLVNKANFKKSGCHHCGTKWGEIIADHQPPNKVYKAMESSLKMTEKMGLGRYALMAFKLMDDKLPPQLLFPQCRRCCQLQSLAVRKEKETLVMHFGGFRPQHLSGVVVGARHYAETSTKS